MPFLDLRSTTAIAIAALLVGVAPEGRAQGLESKETVEKIVGSEVKEEEARAAADAERVIAAIDRTSENIGTVRKISRLDKIDIVFLADAAVTEGGPPPQIEAKVKEHEKEIADLRKEIEGNAMLFHAIDSRQILTRDVLAIDFDSPNTAVIYAAAKPAQ
ncbi:hypothetical protein [Mesorhizobium sp. L-8-10]|uniref:hypothetical protein n=1 Tax=Mesorhizobium sp. L-8-10 TaxID=2744523 RepID=UPI00192794EB|nr:hypothetical protein [Mesorhizobium sp. L-8-10]